MKGKRYAIPFVVGLFAAVVLITSGFHLLGVRAVISKDAQTIKELEHQILVVSDRLRELEVSIDESLQPDVLKFRVKERLGYPVEGQVLRVEGDEIRGGNEFWVINEVKPSGKEGA